MKIITPFKRATAMSLYLGLSCLTLHAGYIITWTGKGPNGNWSEPANWAGSAPSPGDVVRFTTDLNPVRTNMHLDVPNLSFEYLEFKTVEDFTLSAAPNCKVTLLGGQYGELTVKGFGGCEFGPSVEIVLSNQVVFCTGYRHKFAGPITGSGNLELRGHQYIFDGAIPNTFSGTSVIAGAEVYLQRTAGPCLTSPIVVKDEADCYADPDFNEDGNGRLFVQEPASIGTNLNLELVMGDAYFTNANASLASLKLKGGRVSTGTKTLTVLGPIEEVDDYYYKDGTINGNLNLPPAANGTRVVQVGNSTKLTINAQISGAGTKLVKQGGGGLWLNSANGYSGGLRVDQGDLWLNATGAQGLNAGVVEIRTNATVWLGTNVMVANAATAHDGAAIWGSSGAVWSGNIQTLGSVFELGGVEASGVISGSARLEIAYGAELSGDQPNTYTGGTVVDYCPNEPVRFTKTGGALAAPGVLMIDTDAWLEYGGAAQIPATTTVEIHKGGVLDLNGFNQTIDSLALHFGTVATGPGQLTVAQSILVVNTNANNISGNQVTSLLEGNLTFPAGVHAFDVADEAGLIVAAKVHAPAGATVQKIGGGKLVLGGSNDFDAPFLIVAGRVVATNGNAFGSAVAGTSVNGGARLELAHGPVAVASEALELYGKLVVTNAVQAWNGPILLQGADAFEVGAGSTLKLGGAISGAVNFRHSTPGMLEFTGTAANAWTGTTEIQQGTMRLSRHTPGVALPSPSIAIGGFGLPAILELNGNNGLADTAIVTKNADGVLRVLSFEDTFGALVGAGDVELLGGGLSLSNNAATTLAARLTGNGYAAKRGTGQLTSPPNHTFTGGWFVHRGNLQLLGTQPATPVTVNSNGVLSGVAGVGNLTVNSGGKLAPGVNGPGTINAINFVMQPGSTLEADLTGAVTNTPADMVSCNSATLNNPTLISTPASTNAVTNAVSKIIQIKPAAPLAGQFNGFPTGSSIKLGGKFWIVNYEGGDGNDTVLYAQGSIPPVELTGLSIFHGNSVHLTGTGLPNVTYTVEANADLSQPAAWQPIGTATGGVHGALFFSDTNYLNFSKRFYRFKSQ